MRNMNVFVLLRMMVLAFPLLLGAGVGTVYAGGFEDPGGTPHLSGPASLGTIFMDQNINLTGTYIGTCPGGGRNVIVIPNVCGGTCSIGSTTAESLVGNNLVGLGGVPDSQIPDVCKAETPAGPINPNVDGIIQKVTSFTKTATTVEAEVIALWLVP